MTMKIFVAMAVDQVAFQPTREITMQPHGAHAQTVPPPVFDTHVLKRVLRAESDLHDPIPLTDEQIDSDVQEYIEFLRWHRMHPGQECLPEVRVDRVWHIHILQTEQYAQVCEQYLGYFLHHASMICGTGQEIIHPWHYRGQRANSVQHVN